jgi:hypothetical protein
MNYWGPVSRIFERLPRHIGYRIWAAIGALFDFDTIPNDRFRSALIRIKEMSDVGPTCSCGRPNGLPAIIQCVNTALDSPERHAR